MDSARVPEWSMPPRRRKRGGEAAWFIRREANRPGLNLAPRRRLKGIMPAAADRPNLAASDTSVLSRGKP